MPEYDSETPHPHLRNLAANPAAMESVIVSLRAVKNELISPLKCPLGCGRGPGPRHDEVDVEEGKANIGVAADEVGAARFLKAD